MEIKPIFVPENNGNPDGVYAIQLHHKKSNEFSHAMRSWRNREVLYTFFNNNISDLENGFWGDITIEEAILTTIADADKFEATLFAYCRDPRYGLQHVFQPLYNSEYRLISLQKSKGKIRRSWLRLYALRLDRNCFVITGGAIKLTHNMQAVHLQEELQKLERTKVFFQSRNIY